MDVQKTILGTYGDKIVVACRDFTEGGLKFADFGTLKNTCISTSKNGYGTELLEIESAIEEQRWLDPKTLSSFFWDMFICDALIGNFDRHNGNWGFLIDDRKKSARIAPIFDCASSLFPQLRIDDYRKNLDDQSEIEARVYNWPNSSIRIEDRKVNYFEFISSLAKQDCNEALKRVYPRINLDLICAIINNDEDLLEIQKEFYTTILIERKKRILDEGETAGSDVQVVLRDRCGGLRDPVRADSEQQRDALSALHHRDRVRQGHLLLGVGLAGRQYDLPQLGREPLPGVREALEPAGLRHLHEVLAVTADAGGAGHPLRDLLRGAGVLRDREPEQRQTHVVGPGKVPGAGYDPPVGLPEVLVVRVVESYGDPSASHVVTSGSCDAPRWRRCRRP